MRTLAERSWFLLCLALGWLLRSGKYSTTRIVHRDGGIQMRKRRLVHAPLLVAMGGPLLRILDTGVRVLPRRDWEERERLIHRTLRGASVGVDSDGALVLPWLSGEPLATLLEDPELDESKKTAAIALSVIALADFHRMGFTHGDAMAENVMVDLEAGVAHWFDVETVHDSSRPMDWRRADDVRALVASCLLRTDHAELAGTLRLILDVYADERVIPFLAESFTSVLRRPLVLHLGQAGLSLRSYGEIACLLKERAASEPITRSG